MTMNSMYANLFRCVLSLTLMGLCQTDPNIIPGADPNVANWRRRLITYLTMYVVCWWVSSYVSGY
jgi:hypothetical protein